jgi:hypothetical protein
MAGYDGYSMSNSAVAAYNSGERPWSKIRPLVAGWLVKKGLFKTRRVATAALDCQRERGNIHRSSWHHTSSKYNRTDFFRAGHVYAEALERLCGWTLGGRRGSKSHLHGNLE